MKNFSINDFWLDSHIEPKLAAVAARSLDRVLGDEITLKKDDFFRLIPGSTPTFCKWELGKRWGHCDIDGTVTEFDGTRHKTRRIKP